MEYTGDREQEFGADEDEDEEAVLLAEVRRYEAEGLGLAALARTMLAALEDAGLTHTEQLGLVRAALRGR